MLEELCKWIQHCCATLRRSRNKRNVGSCWLKSLTGFKLCATTSKNIQQGVQTDATCNIQQCWELVDNNVASVCTQPNPSNQGGVLIVVDLYQSLNAPLYLLVKQCTTFQGPGRKNLSTYVIVFVNSQGGNIQLGYCTIKPTGRE